MLIDEAAADPKVPPQTSNPSTLLFFLYQRLSTNRLLTFLVLKHSYNQSTLNDSNVIQWLQRHPKSYTLNPKVREY